MTVSQLDIGIDPLSTPAGFFGSPLISSLKGTENLIPIDSHLLVDYKQSTPSWPGITIMFWLRFDDKELQAGNIPILVSIKYYSQKLNVWRVIDVQWYPVSSLNLFFQSNKHTDKNSDRGWVVFKATDNRLGLKLNTNKDGSDTEFETFSYGKISTWITLTDLLQFFV